MKLWRGLSESSMMFVLALIASILLNAIVGHQRSRFNTLCRGICGTRELLPGSCASLDTLLDTCDRPFASGASTDMHKRTPNGSKACVRKVRMYSKGDPQKKRVCYHYFSFSCSYFLRVLQVFYWEAATWKHPNHPNVVPFLGATLDLPQLASAWMPGSGPPEKSLLALVRFLLPH